MATAASSVSITSENQNFYRLIRLLVTTGTKVLCSIMEQKAIATYHKTTFQEVLDDPNVKKVLHSLYPSDPKKKKIINASQWNSLYPAIGDSDTSEYDISLLMILIRNICNFPKKFNWDSLPASGDARVEANIARLKHFRNEICMHSASASVDDKLFHQYFDDIKCAILGLSAGSHLKVSGIDIEKLRKEITTDSRLWKRYVDLGNQWADDERHVKKILQTIEGRTKNLQETTKRIEEKTATGVEEIAEKMEQFSEGVKKEMRNIAEGVKVELKQHIESLLASANEESSKTVTKEDSFDQQMSTFCDILRDFYITNMSEMEVLDEDDRVPMEDIFVSLSWYQQQKPSSRGEKEELKNYWEMFDIQRPFDKRLPRRILIEGTVGMGKSVFSQKVCLDWAGRNFEPLNRFQILLHITLAEVEEHASLQDIIFSQLEVEISDDTKKDIMFYIQETQNKILLVFDGYDEYSNKNQDINKIFTRRTLRDCCVIITSRPWKTVDEKSIKHYDLFLELEGFRQESAIREYTEKFMQLKSEEGETGKLAEMFMMQLKKQNLLSFVQAPFLLMISCLLFLENQSHIPEKVTEMYQKLIDLLFDRFEKRSKCPKNIERHEMMLALGKLSYDTMVSGEPLLFQKGEIMKEYGDVLFHTGLLTQNKYRSRQGRYNVSFPHKSFAEFLAAYYLQNDEKEFDRFLKMNRNFMENTTKFENVLKFLCGLLQINCLPLLRQLFRLVKQSEIMHEKKKVLFKNEMPEHIYSYRGLSVFLCTLLLQCINEGNRKWEENVSLFSFLVVNEDTFRMIPEYVELCAKNILISRLESSQLSSIYRRLDMTTVETIGLENQTGLDEFYDFIQQNRERPRVIEIRHSKMAALQNIEHLKCHPALEELTIADLELSHNDTTPATGNTISLANIQKLSITDSSPSVTQYFLDDDQVLKKLVQITTAGQIIIRLLQAQSLKKVKVIHIDNEKIKEPGNRVYFDEFIKLIALNPTITDFSLRHCLVVVSRRSISEDQGSRGQIEEATVPAECAQEVQSCTRNKDLAIKAVKRIEFDECSFVDENRTGFQALEIFEKLVVLKFYLCNIPLPLLTLLGKSLSNLKFLQTFIFKCSRACKYPLKYLTSSIDPNNKWKYMNNFTVLDCLTCKEDMEAVMSMVKMMPNLTRLRLYNDSEEVISSVQPDTIEPLLNQGMVYARMKKLVLNGLKLKRRIGSMLQTIRPLRYLESIDISWNGFDDTDAATLLAFIEDICKKDLLGKDIFLPKLVSINLYAASFSFEKKKQFAKCDKPSLHVHV